MATIGVQHHSMFIDGKAVDADSFYEIRSPATEELVCTVAKGTVEHADQAVEAARRSFEAGVWSGLPSEERSRIMKAIADRLAPDLVDRKRRIGRQRQRLLELVVRSELGEMKEMRGGQANVEAVRLASGRSIARDLRLGELIELRAEPMCDRLHDARALLAR